MQHMCYNIRPRKTPYFTYKSSMNDRSNRSTYDEMKKAYESQTGPGPYCESEAFTLIILAINQTILPHGVAHML